MNNDKNVGLWLQAFGGLCHLAAAAVGFVGFLKSGSLQGFAATVFLVAWLAVTSFLLTRAGQNYEA